MTEKLPMRIYDLHVIDIDAWPHQTLSCVVAAYDESSARKVAGEASFGDWTDPALVECRELLADEFDGPCVVVLDTICPKCDIGQKSAS